MELGQAGGNAVILLTYTQTHTRTHTHTHHTHTHTHTRTHAHTHTHTHTQTPVTNDMIWSLTVQSVVHLKSPDVQIVAQRNMPPRPLIDAVNSVVSVSTGRISSEVSVCVAVYRLVRRGPITLVIFISCVPLCGVLLDGKISSCWAIFFNAQLSVS